MQFLVGFIPAASGEHRNANAGQILQARERIAFGLITVKGCEFLSSAKSVKCAVTFLDPRCDC